jgi:hypothetical protein
MPLKQALCLAAMVLVWPAVVVAQSSHDEPSVRAGDRWTYETKDEITGEGSGTVVDVVTEVSDKEFDVRRAKRGGSGGWLIAYDHEWNRLDNSVWKFKPNDGQGIRVPLVVGKEWQAEFESSNMKNGTVLEGAVRTKVAARESITTAAGTFDTFRLETHTSTHVTEDPSKVADNEVVTWYAPQINHWVKRTTTFRVEKRIRSSISEELVDFGRKQ